MFDCSHSKPILTEIYEEYHTHTTAEKPSVLDYGCNEDCPKGYDVIYSVKELQHSPQPLFKKRVKSIVEALNENGLALLHAPYFIDEDHFTKTQEAIYYLTKEDFVAVVEEAGGKVVAYNHKYDLIGGGIKNCIYIVSKSQKSIFKRMLNHTEPQHWSDIFPSGDFTKETKDATKVE